MYKDCLPLIMDYDIIYLVNINSMLHGNYRDKIYPLAYELSWQHNRKRIGDFAARARKFKNLLFGKSTC